MIVSWFGGVWAGLRFGCGCVELILVRVLWVCYLSFDCGLFVCVC